MNQTQPPARPSRAREAAQIVRTLLREPRYFAGGEEPTEGTNYVEPLDELAVEEGNVQVYPVDGYLSDAMSVLQDRTIWAIDGGILTWQFPNGRFLLGRAVLVRMSFSGYDTVQAIHEYPVIPFVLQPPPAPPTAVQHVFDDIIRDYIEYVGNLIPGQLPLEGPAKTRYFTDADEFLAEIPREYYAADAAERERIVAHVDAARNAAETIAFLHALRYARAGDIVMRDGRIHGNVGFLTGLLSDEASGTPVIRRLMQSIIDAVNRDVKVIGVIKRPVSAYCCRWFAQNDVERARYAPADTVLYHRLLENRERFALSYGKRSNLWRIRARGADLPIDIDRTEGRSLINWFYQNTGLFYLKPRDGIPPLRVDFITYGNMYRAWIEDLVNEVYALCRGSGSPAGLPHPIAIADNYAKVHRVELNASINEIITSLEASDDPTDLEAARELRAYLDIRYAGGLR
ncbi:MAG: DNA double-strand break repair nuclease NurA [Anaerolineae bacterium]|nr:DNA double-strand break repair nuclease NurA [Anaerolineae bacterium]